MRAQLTALLDEHLRRLPLEPGLHDKRLLGAHAQDLASSLEDLGGRLLDQRVEPLRPAETRERLRRLDPIGDGPEFAALTLLLRRQERHALELPPKLVEPVAETTPARDPFVEVGPAPPTSHAELNHALIVAEVAAVTAPEAPELIALVAAKLEQTAELEARLERPWGSEPVDLSEYDRLLALPVEDRVEQLLGEGRRGDEDPGP